MNLRLRRLRARLLAAGLGLVPTAAAEAAQEVEPAPGALRTRPEERVARHLDAYDPGVDGWASEQAAGQAQALFSALADQLAAEGAPAADALAPHLVEGARVEPLRTEELREVHRGAAFRVRRAAGGYPPPEPGAGPEGLAAALAALGLADWAERRVALKVDRIQPEGEGWLVRLRYHASGARAGRRVEQSGMWRAVLQGGAEGAPRLGAIGGVEFEEVEGPAGGGSLLVDCTGALFEDPGLFEAQLAEGLGAWQRRLSVLLNVSVMGDQGLALGDVDGDGLEDLYLCQPGGLPNRLLLRTPEGRLRDASAASGTDLMDVTSSALLVDLDGDRDLDLALAAADEVLFFENDGAARFRLRAALPATTPMSLAAADVELDGDLDVFVCGYFSPYDDTNAPVPYHDARNGAQNTLCRNDGDFRFVDATVALGLAAGGPRFSFAASFEDYDDDGDVDLYVANDFGRNNLFRNDGGAFVDVAAAAGVEDISAGMGVSWGDFDGDGQVDLYVSNMDSKAGKRIAYQRRFQADADADTRAAYRRHARGNSLFRNAGDGTFVDVSEERGVSNGLWAWGSIFCDLDLDGRLDVAVPNGFVTSDLPDDL